MQELEWAVTQPEVQALHARPEVVGIGVGQRREGEHWTDQVVLVVRVTLKHPREELERRALLPIPQTISVPYRDRVIVLPTDVQTTGGAREGRLQGWVGRRLDCEDATFGTVGGIVRDSLGRRRVVTAGHVVRRKGMPVSLDGCGGQATRVHESALLDIGLVAMTDPVPDSATKLYPSNLKAMGIRVVNSALVKERVSVRGAGADELRETTVRAVHATARFKLPEGGSTRVDLVATDAVTEDGDSGAVLLDSSYNAIGILMGIFGDCSYFLPCDRSFHQLAIQPEM